MEAFIILYRSLPMHRARVIADEVVRAFIERELDEVRIIFTQMQNAVSMENVNMQLLPLKKASFQPQEIPVDIHQEELEFSPSPDAVLDIMIPDYITGLLYGCLVEAYASRKQCQDDGDAGLYGQCQGNAPRNCPFSITVHARLPSPRRSPK